MNDNEESTKINATALRRIDPTFTLVHGIASKVAVCRYNTATQSWDNTDTVGCMFLYERNVSPQYGLVVMNRKNENYFLQRFGPGGQFVLHQPYLLLRAVGDVQNDPTDSHQAIHCLRFYEPQDCMASANVLRKMGLKFEGEGDTFDKIGGTEFRLPVSADSPASSGQLAGNMLFKGMQRGNREVVHENHGRRENHSGATVMTAEQLEAQTVREPAGLRSEPVARSENGGACTPKRVPTPLLKEQLFQAMMYLLENDPEFVTTIHDGYVLSLHANSPDGRRHFN